MQIWFCHSPYNLLVVSDFYFSNKTQLLYMATQSYQINSLPSQILLCYSLLWAADLCSIQAFSSLKASHAFSLCTCEHTFLLSLPGYSDIVLKFQLGNHVFKEALPERESCSFLSRAPITFTLCLPVHLSVYPPESEKSMSSELVSPCSYCTEKYVSTEVLHSYF